MANPITAIASRSCAKNSLAKNTVKDVREIGYIDQEGGSGTQTDVTTVEQQGEKGQGVNVKYSGKLADKDKFKADMAKDQRLYATKGYDVGDMQLDDYINWKNRFNAQQGNEEFQASTDDGTALKPEEITDDMVNTGQTPDTFKEVEKTKSTRVADTTTVNPLTGYGERLSGRRATQAGRKVNKFQRKSNKAENRADKFLERKGGSIEGLSKKDKAKYDRLMQKSENFQTQSDIQQSRLDLFKEQADQKKAGTQGILVDEPKTAGQIAAIKYNQKQEEGGSSLFKGLGTQVKPSNYKLNLPSLQSFTEKYLNEKGAITSKPSGEGSSIPANQNPADFNKPGADTALFKVRGPIKRNYFK
jgi:hypothetical protein